jgi:hypothetical protein
MSHYSLPLLEANSFQIIIPTVRLNIFQIEITGATTRKKPTPTSTLFVHQSYDQQKQDQQHQHQHLLQSLKRQQQ